LAERHWRLGLGSGLVVAVPVPDEAGLADEESAAAISRAVSDADAAGVHGPASTPWVLARVAELTEGRSVTANLALIENNARVAGEIAVALAEESLPSRM
jgi:pseudouridine-5'-phosphate glycosidase